MLLQRTGLNIKQFINSRKSGVDEGRNASEMPERVKESLSRPRSWMSQKAKGIDDTILSAANGTAASRIEPPIATLENTHSSASSLCSCDCDSNNIWTPHSLSKTASSRSSPNAVYQDFQYTTARKDAKKRIHLFSNTFLDSASSMRSAVPVIAPASIINLFEALSMDPDDSHTIPTQESLNMESTPAKQWSDNVEHLIRETDDAFKAVTQGWNDKRLNESSGENTAKSMVRNQVPVLATRHASVSKQKRRRFGKSKVNHSKYRKLALQALPSSAIPSPRWMDKKADLFGGGIFGRLEVDEMLKPGRLSRPASGQDAKPKQSSETTSSGSANEILTPLEPFHLDDLSSRLGSTSIVSDPDEFTSPRQPPAPPIPNKNDRCTAEHANLNMYYQSSRQPSALEPSRADQSNTLQFENLKFPSPPHRSSCSHPTTRASNLATIRELSPVTPNKGSSAWSPVSSGTVSPISPMSPASERKGAAALLHTAIQRGFHRKSRKQPEASTPQLLESTPYSMNSPLFRHGSIRLNKTARCENPRLADSEPGTPMSIGTPRRNVENERSAALDWTAFQMAISGGAGDFLMGGEGVESRLEMMQELEKEVDEILEWWDGFGFSDKDRGYGKIVREKTRKKKSTAKRNQEAVPRIATSHNTELPATTGKGKVVNIPEASHSAEPKEQHKSGYESDYSLPDSPMGEISPEAIGRGSMVLMGFNLGHDLPDFLKWEAEHAEALPGL